MVDLSIAFKVRESIAMAVEVLWDAFATPEPGFLTCAFKGMAV